MRQITGQIAPEGGALAYPIETPMRRKRRAAQLSEETLAAIGLYDHVTRLPNRKSFIEAHAPIPGNASEMLVLVTLADAPHFNEILRALGHGFSEDFIRAGARRLGALLGPDVVIYHVSVLSFAFVIPYDGHEEAPAIVRDVARLFDEPLICDDIPIKTQAAIGLVEPGALDTSAEILRAALVAAQDGRSRNEPYAWYDRRSDAAHRRAFTILTDLPRALEASDQLALHYQPRIDFRTGRCVAVEALLRWAHPELGQIPPGEFIALAEKTALIGPITDWVLTQSVEQAGHWQRQGLDIAVSINASPINLAEPDFDARLIGLCHDSKVDAERIELEFTEGTLITNPEHTFGQLARLRDIGMKVAIDDFGSGYSNMSHLARIPADVLKIDRSFAFPLGTGSGNALLVGHIVALAKGLNLRVVAEGIENRNVWDRLKSLECDEGQGYFMARPMPPEDFVSWYRDAAPIA